jgi:hypothetical protein
MMFGEGEAPFRSQRSFPMKNAVLLLLAFWCAACTQSNVDSNTVTPVPASLKSEATPAPGSRNAAQMVAAGFHRYGIEKGRLIFRIDGAVKGTEVIYFDHWGWREGKYVRTEADVGAYHEKTNKAQYLDGERRYEYDPETNTANYFDSPQVEASAKKYQTKDMVKVGDEMIKRMGGVHIKAEEFQGVMCDVWEIGKYRTTLHMWQGLTLKERSFVSNIPVGRTCLSILTDADIPVEKMTVPAGAVEVEVRVGE